MRICLKKSGPDFWPRAPDISLEDARFRLALYGDNAKKIHDRDGETETCSMCGDLCVVKMVNELFGTGAVKKKGKK